MIDATVLDVETLVGCAVGLLLLTVTWPFVKRGTRLDPDPSAGRLLKLGLVLKLLAAPAYLIVIGAVYKSGDYTLYSKLAVQVAHQYRAFNFTHVQLAGPNALNSQDRMVDYVCAGVYAVVGNTILGATFFFSWLAFLGQYLAYRAFVIAVPEGDHKRFRRLIFLFPSMLFWTATIGKDAIIALGIGLAFCGLARVWSKARLGWIMVAAGVGLMMTVRPNVVLIILAALIPAYVLGRPARRRVRGAASKVAGGAVILVLALLFVPAAEHFLGIKDLGVNSINHRLKGVASTTSTGSQNFGSNGQSKNRPTVIDDPVALPVDVVTVLFRPFPWEAPTTVTLLAGLESLFLLCLALVSWRRIVAAARRVRRRPYVGFACFFVGAFICAFASIGNFGILARERVQTLPACFVVLAASPRRRRSSGPIPQALPSTRGAQATR